MSKEKYVPKGPDEQLDSIFTEPKHLPLKIRDKIRTVLMLEDTPMVADVLARVYEYLGVERVIHAISGEGALQIFQSEKIDLVSADRRVPGLLHGEDFVSIVRRIDPAIPIIIISAEPEDRKFNADGYLKKPFGLEKLREELARMESILRERSSWSEEQAVDFVKRTTTQVDDSIIRISGWDSSIAMKYVGLYTTFGLKPILSYNPVGPIAMVNKDGIVIVNLHESIGPQDITFSAGEYFAAHEAIEVHSRNEGVDCVIPKYELPRLEIKNPEIAARVGGSVYTYEKYAREVMIERGVTQYYTKAINDDYCRWLEYDVSSQQRRSEIDLSYIAYMQVVAEMQSHAVPALGERLMRISRDYRKITEDAIGDEETLRVWYNGLVKMYTDIFKSTKVDTEKIQESERRIKKS